MKTAQEAYNEFVNSLSLEDVMTTDTEHLALYRRGYQAALDEFQAAVRAMHARLNAQLNEHVNHCQRKTDIPVIVSF